MTHAIEAFTAIDHGEFPLPQGQVALFQGRNPLGDCLAERAIALIGANLARAVEHPSDLAARETMSLGALFAGMAFSNVGVALVHALEYPIGGLAHCTHGAGNGMLLPHVMRYHLPVREVALARIAELLGEDTHGMGQAEAAERAIVAVEITTRDLEDSWRFLERGVIGAARKELDRAEQKEHGHDAKRKAEIANAVGDEGLDGGVVGAALLIPEADQQVGRDTHAFPAEEKLQEVVRCHQRQHREGEE